ncbi:MAG: DUF2589 domain-containing protein [Lachnospiraceae bacterium]|nr:DUF2589 domain-containing protein [Lachnospiraceae bacterium]
MKIENLIISIGEAIQDAHKIMEQKYVSNFFDRYFVGEMDESTNKYTYRPKTVEILFENTRDLKVISAPVAALVQHTNMNLDYVKLNLNISVINESKDEIEITSQASEDESGADRTKYGELELMFKCRNAPEGMARIETYLNGVL